MRNLEQKTIIRSLIDPKWISMLTVTSWRRRCPWLYNHMTVVPHEGRRYYKDVGSNWRYAGRTFWCFVRSRCSLWSFIFCSVHRVFGGRVLSRFIAFSSRLVTRNRLPSPCSPTRTPFPYLTSLNLYYLLAPPSTQAHIDSNNGFGIRLSGLEEHSLNQETSFSI